MKLSRSIRVKRRYLARSCAIRTELITPRSEQLPYYAYFRLSAPYMCKSERYKMLRKIKKCYPGGKFPYTFTEFIYWCTFVQKVNCPRDPGAYCPTAATVGTKTVIVTVFPTAVNFLPPFLFLRCDLWSLNSSGELQFVPIQALTNIIMVS